MDINILGDDPETTEKLNITDHSLFKREFNVFDPEVFKKYYEFHKLPLSIEVSTKYDFHLRYQSCSQDGSLYTNITFGQDTKVLFDCENQILTHFSDLYWEYRSKGINMGVSGYEPTKLENILTEEDQKPSAISVLMPVCDANDLEWS